MALDSHVHLFRPGEDGDPRTLLMLHGRGGAEASFAGLGFILALGAAVLSVRGHRAYSTGLGAEVSGGEAGGEAAAALPCAASSSS